MSSWIIKPLGDLITLQRGHDLPSQDRKEGSVPIMGSSGITGFHNVVKTAGPGVVVGRSGNSMGYVSFSPVDYWPLNTCLYVTDFKGNDERYIYYLLQTIDFDQFNSGSAQKSLNRNAVYPYELKTTECKDEQIRIGRVLAALEDKIKLNRQTNQTLEQIAQAIFKSWFVDFEPTRAKIAAKQNGQDPERAAMAAISGAMQGCTNAASAGGAGAAKTLEALDQLSPEQQAQLKATAALFPNALVDSELGETPEGWEVDSLGTIMDIAGGTQPPAKEFIDQPKEGYIRLIQIRDYATSNHPAFIPHTKKLRTTKKTDIMIARYGASVGRICWGMEGAYNVALVKVICDDHYREYLRTYLLSSVFQLRLAQMSGRSAQAGFNKSDIASFTLVIPSEKIISIYQEFSWSLRENILQNKLENSALENLRNSLLPKLLSGELLIESSQTKLAAASG